ncbi:hypothetical protein [Methanosarcina horonobensis]
MRDDQGNILFYQGYLCDITERKTARRLFFTQK